MKLKQRLKQFFKKPEIEFMVFWIGQKCSLKCKLCCNLIPYMKQNSYNINEILSDFKFLSQNSKIKFLQIQGGEPFTHPNITQILDFIGNIYNNNTIGGGGVFLVSKLQPMQLFISNKKCLIV